MSCHATNVGETSALLVLGVLGGLSVCGLGNHDVVELSH